MSGENHRKRTVAGWDGIASQASGPDGLQVLAGGRYVNTDLSDFPTFDPDRETPIGSDDRTLVERTTEAPWRKICQLSYRIPGVGAARGTGWLAGPRTVITAGHCILDPEADNDGLARDMTVAPGRGGKGLTPFGVFRAARMSVHPKWLSDRNLDFDIGCIQLDQPVGIDTGWFAFASFDDGALENASVNISGYPVYGPNGVPLNGMVPFFHNNRISAVHENRIFYEVDTSGGQSGAPVWMIATEDDPPTVIGVHAYGEGEEISATQVGEANSATRLTSENIALIEQWVEESGGRTAAAMPSTDSAGPVLPASESGSVASSAASMELRQFIAENASTAGRRLEGAVDAALPGNSAAEFAVGALNAAVTKFDELSGRLLRRSRVQQRLDLYASIGTLILSSSLFAAAQTDNKQLTFVVGLLTILFAVIALVAKRMGGGEGGLVQKYIELKSVAFEARLLADIIDRKVREGETTLDADIENALTTTRRLAKERDWMQASDFLFRDGGWMMRLLGDPR